MYFDEKKIRKLVLEYQKNKDNNIAEEILKESHNIIMYIIHYHRYYRFEDMEDLIQEGNIILFNAISSYDPNYIGKDGNPASVFNYFTKAVKLGLRSYTSKKSNRKERWHTSLDDEETYIQAVYHEDILDKILTEEFLDKAFNSFIARRNNNRQLDEDYKYIHEMLKEYIYIYKGNISLTNGLSRYISEVHKKTTRNQGHHIRVYCRYLEKFYKEVTNIESEE